MMKAMKAFFFAPQTKLDYFVSVSCVAILLSAQWFPIRVRIAPATP